MIVIYDLTIVVLYLLFHHSSSCAESLTMEIADD